MSIASADGGRPCLVAECSSVGVRRPYGGFSTGGEPEAAIGSYPPAVRRQRIPAGQQLGRLAVAGLISGSVLLAGCGAEPEQEASTELPSASSTSTEPTPELPPLGPADFPVPDEARVQTEAGAEAFLRYYIDLINHQQTIPDGQPLRDLGPDCEDCLRVARQYEQLAEKEASIEGGELSILTDPGVVGRDRGLSFGFLVRIEALTIRDSAGNPMSGQSAPALPRVASGALVTWSRADHSWHMSTLTIE